MTRRSSFAAAIAAAAVAVVLGSCSSNTSSEPAAQTSDATVVEPEASATPLPEPDEHIDVDPALYSDEYVAGVSFGVGSGEVNCQITESTDDPSVAAWGCAVFRDQTWQWEDTAFAEYCAQFEEFGCRNGLIVQGSDAPTPRRNTDSDFGGLQASHLLADGERITVGTVSCMPANDGVRCEDDSTGHGFELSVVALDSW